MADPNTAIHLSALCGIFGVQPALETSSDALTIFVDVPRTIERIYKEYYNAIDKGVLSWKLTPEEATLNFLEDPDHPDHKVGD